MVTIFKLFLICNSVNSIFCDHWSERADLIAKEEAVALGSSIKLEGIEKCVNKSLMHLKLTELDRGLDNPNEFYPSTNFLKTVKYIDASEVYNFIKDIPKGAALHLHDMAMASPDYLYELTFHENLFVCRTRENRLLLNFFLFHVDNRCDWTPLESAREEEGFEDLLQTQLSMDTPVYKKFSNNKVAWSELLGTYATIEGLISYKPIFTSYLTDVLNKMYEDNVMYVELRTTLLPVYDLDGNDYGPSDVVSLLRETLADFRCAHNDFLGGKIIYSPSRMVDQSWMDRYVQIVDELSSEHSDFVAGFDLTGQEDLSYPLSRFISSFKEMKSKVHFFFSAGETNWIGAKADLNLFDAVLLNPTRIGHAFTLFGHPELLKIVKDHDIAIELCPISNQMMMLVSDLRNHPGKFLISHGYPIVVSSDNPGFWGARTLSHDWYMVFMAMADRKADLRLLKQLAINSIKYSTITDKEEALILWNKKWDAYMAKMEQWCIDNDPHDPNSVTEKQLDAKTTIMRPISNSWLPPDTEDQPSIATWFNTRRTTRILKETETTTPTTTTMLQSSFDITNTKSRWTQPPEWIYTRKTAGYTGFEDTTESTSLISRLPPKMPIRTRWTEQEPSSLISDITVDLELATSPSVSITDNTMHPLSWASTETTTLGSSESTEQLTGSEIQSQSSEPCDMPSDGSTETSLSVESPSTIISTEEPSSVSEEITNESDFSSVDLTSDCDESDFTIDTTQNPPSSNSEDEDCEDYSDITTIFPTTEHDREKDEDCLDYDDITSVNGTVTETYHTDTTFENESTTELTQNSNTEGTTQPTGSRASINDNGTTNSTATTVVKAEQHTGAGATNRDITETRNAETNTTNTNDAGQNGGSVKQGITDASDGVTRVTLTNGTEPTITSTNQNNVTSAITNMGDAEVKTGGVTLANGTEPTVTSTNQNNVTSGIPNMGDAEVKTGEVTLANGTEPGVTSTNQNNVTSGITNMGNPEVRKGGVTNANTAGVSVSNTEKTEAAAQQS